MTSNRVMTFPLVFPNPEDGFSTLFEEELDSAYSSGVVCCDKCFDEFTKKWPFLNARDPEFSGADLLYFYQNSALAEIFSEDDFKRLLAEQIECPRCGSPLNFNMWLYEFGFDLPPDFERALDEIAKIATKTPLLVAQHPFALLVRKEIERVASLGTILPSGNVLFRGRILKPGTPPAPSEFGPPPASKTREGRYNHIEMPVLYLGSDPQTCQRELRRADGDLIHVAELSLSGPLKLLDLDRLRVDGSEVLGAMVLSSMVSAPAEGGEWNVPEYRFSRYVADCARDAGFNAIKYPSLRAEGTNVAVFVDDKDWGKWFEVGKIYEFAGKSSA